MPCSSTSSTSSSSPPNRCLQLSRILSNTGLVSATELLMTCSTSAAAFCCCSDSCVSLNSRTFSIAIAAWSANEVTSSISLASKARASARPSVSTPIVSPSRRIGTASSVR